jgi:hypothetical protein
MCPGGCAQLRRAAIASFPVAGDAVWLHRSSHWPNMLAEHGGQDMIMYVTKVFLSTFRS